MELKPINLGYICSWSCTCGGDYMHGCKSNPKCCNLSDAEKAKNARVDAAANLVRRSEEARGNTQHKTGAENFGFGGCRMEYDAAGMPEYIEPEIALEAYGSEAVAHTLAASPATVPGMLRAAASIYEERNKLYKNDYKEMGACLAILFPEGVRLDSPEDFNRFSLFRMIFAKITRYSKQFANGGHPDSLDDLAVYAMMLQEIDKEYAQ